MNIIEKEDYLCYNAYKIIKLNTSYMYIALLFLCRPASFMMSMAGRKMTSLIGSTHLATRGAMN